MARKKAKGTELSVFKGREAKLNRAIFLTLAAKGPQTAYDIHKQVTLQTGLKRTHYASANKRIRILEKLGYIRKSSIKETRAGFEASVYELCAKAYLAMLLRSTSLEELLMKANEQTAQNIMADILGALKS
jgi:DNA-binding PadR family transcriptional regulator